MHIDESLRRNSSSSGDGSSGKVPVMSIYGVTFVARSEITYESK